MKKILSRGFPCDPLRLPKPYNIYVFLRVNSTCTICEYKLPGTQDIDF
jgi:hypothetical protein